MIRHTKNKEFLLTDGKGGYSFLPLDWKNKRKYHSFFTSSLGGPSRRFVLFSAVDGLTPNRFIFPNQFEASDFSSSVLLGDGFRLDIHAKREVEFKPFFNFRYIYDIRDKPGDSRFRLGNSEMTIWIDNHEIKVGLKGEYKFTSSPEWKEFDYTIDKERGESWADYNFSPGVFRVFGKFRLTIPVIATRLHAVQKFFVDWNKRRYIIAGYPWFSSWTRDSMIFSKWLLADGKFRDVREVLIAIYSYSNGDGVLPDHIDERSGKPVYTGVEPNLWFLSILGSYVNQSGDTRILDEVDVRRLVNPVLGHLDDYFLIDSTSWMDTLQRDKPVEAQGLLYDSLIKVSKFFKDSDVDYIKLARSVRRAFKKEYVSKFILDSFNDDRFRPNFLLLAYLDNKLVDPSGIRRSLDRAYDELVTPFGVRTLSPTEDGYKGNYKRYDDSYHNGTVWPWLVGPLFDSTVYAGYKIDRIKGIIDVLSRHRWGSGVIGQVNEIFDGDPPYKPRGCPAQAWSLSEFQRVKLLLNSSVGKPQARIR